MGVFMIFPFFIKKLMIRTNSLSVKILISLILFSFSLFFFFIACVVPQSFADGLSPAQSSVVAEMENTAQGKLQKRWLCFQHTSHTFFLLCLSFRNLVNNNFSSTCSRFILAAREIGNTLEKPGWGRRLILKASKLNYQSFKLKPRNFL